MSTVGTRFPAASWIATAGWIGKALLADDGPGEVVKVTFAAGPAMIEKLALTDDAIPVADAVRV